MTCLDKDPASESSKLGVKTLGEVEMNTSCDFLTEVKANRWIQDFHSVRGEGNFTGGTILIGGGGPLLRGVIGFENQENTLYFQLPVLSPRSRCPHPDEEGGGKRHFRKVSRMFQGDGRGSLIWEGQLSAFALSRSTYQRLLHIC